MSVPRSRRPGATPMINVRVYVTRPERDLLASAAARVPGRPLSLSRYLAEAALAAAGAPPARRASGPAPSRLVVAELMDAVAAVNRVGDELDRLAGPAGLRPPTAALESAARHARAALERLTEITADVLGRAS